MIQQLTFSFDPFAGAVVGGDQQVTDDGAWLNAPGGLVRADGTPKPAYRALRGLIKDQWWLGPTKVRTDADGRLGVEGFVGDYRVTAGDRSGTLTVGSGGGVVDVVVA